jgi:hypothetical protein
MAALFGHGAMPDLSPECALKRTSADRCEFMGSRPWLLEGSLARHSNERPRRTGPCFRRDDELGPLQNQAQLQIAEAEVILADPLMQFGR